MNMDETLKHHGKRPSILIIRHRMRKIPGQWHSLTINRLTVEDFLQINERHTQGDEEAYRALNEQGQ